MARQDIAGLLTGISSTQQPVQPIPGTPGFRGQFGAARAQGLGAGLGRMMRGGEPSTQERIQGALSKLDLNNPDDLATLAKVQQARGDLAGAAQTASKIEALKQYQEKLDLEERKVAATEAEVGGAGIGKLNPQMYTPESLQQFSENLQETGEKDYGLLKEIDLVKKTFEIKTSEDIVKKIGERSEQLSSSAQRQSSLNQMSRLLDTGLKTGSLAGLSKSFKGVLSSVLGVEIEGLAEAEALEAISNKLALEVRNPASGMGLPGATSNRDLDFLIAAIPGLRKSVKGNRLMIALAKEQHKMRQALNREQSRIIKENGGYAPLDLENQLASFYTAYQIDPALKKEAEELLDPSITERTWVESDLEEKLAAFKNSQVKPRKRGPQ
jgi:hypothetical protein